jgi:hypothetical protein
VDILAILDSIDLSPEGQTRILYTAVAIDRTNLRRAKWSGSIDVDITATQNQIATAATTAIKAAAADNLGESVPGNVRMKVLGA